MQSVSAKSRQSAEAGQLEWEALVHRADGSVHARHTFWMPVGSTEGQARYRAWVIWSPARAYGSTSDHPIAAYGLIVRPVAAALERAA